MRKFIFGLTASAAVIGIGVAAFAHSGAMGVVKERMDAMKEMGEAVKTVAAMMKGETDYDAATVREKASVIKSHAGKSMTELFPDGSNDGVSEAKDDIWSDWESFNQLASQLEVFATGLERAAENGLMHGNEGNSNMGAGAMMGTQNMMGTGTAGMMGTQNMTGGGNGMMMGNGNMMMGNSGAFPDASQLAQMPADGVFNMMTKTCSACHTKFRVEKD